MIHKFKPRDYQLEAQTFFRKSGGRCLWSLPCGSGKTFSALRLRDEYPKLKKTLVICPASVKIQWRKNFEELFPEESCYVASGGFNKEKGYDVFSSDCVIINYDILRSSNTVSWDNALMKIYWDFLIIDESHKVKNMEASRTKVVTNLSKNTKALVELSGTPIMNTIKDLWSQLHIIDSRVWESSLLFENTYCPRIKRFVKTKKGTKLVYVNGTPRKVDELKHRIAPYVFIKTDKEVFPYLEETTVINVPVQPDLNSAYNQISEAFFSSDLGSEEGRKEASENLQELRKQCGLSKIKSSIDWIDDWMETNPDNKLVVFGYHREFVERLHEHYKKESVLYYGGMSPEQKEKSKEKFINDENCKLFIANVISGGTGVDGLHTVTNTAVLCEFDLIPANNEQAQARIRRANSEYEKYFCYYLVAEGTIDDRIIELLEFKKKNADSVLKSSGTTHTEDLRFLLRKNIK